MTSAAEIASALGGKANGSGYMCRCPAHDDHTPSLNVTDRDGRVLLHCFAGCSQDAVIEELRQRGLFGSNGTPCPPHGAGRHRQPRARSKNFRSDTLPPTMNVPTHPTLGRASAWWLYPDAHGTPAYVVCRFDRPGSDKTFRPYALAGQKWQEPAKTPLYRLPELLADPGKPVLIVAGEKSANAAGEVGFLTTSIMGGEGKVAKAELEPLRGRTVYAWRDADEAGKKWLEALGVAAARVGFELRIVPLPDGASDGQDIADLIDIGGWSAEEIAGQLDMAEAVEAAEPPAVTTTPRFPLVTIAGICDLPPVSYLVDQVLTEGGLSMLAGFTASGKSFLALDLALCVATRTPFRGDLEVKSGPVVYVAAEGYRGLGSRTKAWLAYRGLTDTRAIPLHFVAGAPQLTRLADLDAFLTTLTAMPVPPVLVTIDTLARCFQGKDERNETDMGEYITALERIQRETGAHVCTVHHSGWNQERERGSVALRAGMDTAMLVTREDSTVTLTCTKMKDDEEFAELAFRLQAEGDSAVLRPLSKDDRSTRPAVIPTTRQRALDAVRACDDGSGATYTKSHETSGLAKATFARCMTDLVSWGLIRRSGKKYAVAL